MPDCLYPAPQSLVNPVFFPVFCFVAISAKVSPLMIKQIKNIITSNVIITIFAALLSGCAGGSFLFGGASTISPEERIEAAKVVPPPHHIVLMLPLKGPLASTSKFIRNGFLAAYYYAKATQPDVVIKVVDTTNGNVADLYNQAVLLGANVVVGPLTKTEVEEIANMSNITVPIIALNTLDNYQSRSIANLYQFGLLPQDEAVTVANQMISNNLRRAAIIAPEGPWGEKIANAFREKFEQAGGQVVVVKSFAVTEDLAQEVCQMVAQDPEKLCVRHRHKKRESGVGAEEQQPMRRQDLDSIFMVANPAQGRQIVPLLKFYYAGDLPVYSISSIYSGRPAPTLDQDLNGVIFCDSRWIVRDPAALSVELSSMHKQFTELSGSVSANNSRLYALGIDAYNLSQSLSNILASPEAGFAGATGTLILDGHNHFSRELIFAEFQNGVVQEKQ